MPDTDNDVAAITTLLALYGNRLDRGDHEGWVALFAPDGRFEVYGRVYEGHEGLRRMAAAAPAGLHLTGHPLVEIDGDRATVEQSFPSEWSWPGPEYCLRVSRERLTVRYKGNPEGVNILVGLLRQQGLKVSHGLALNLPLSGQHWSLRRDIVQVYGTVLDVSGRSGAGLSAELAIEEFKHRFPEAAEIKLGMASGG